MNSIIHWFKKFWRKHIVDDFPYPTECFDCDRTSCNGCKIAENENFELKNRFQEIIQENTRLSNEWQECHAYNNEIVSENQKLKAHIKKLEEGIKAVLKEVYHVI